VWIFPISRSVSEVWLRVGPVRNEDPLGLFLSVGIDERGVLKRAFC